MLRPNKAVNVYIFSAELSALNSDLNKKRTRRMEAILTAWRVPYTKVIGSYKGALETSFRVEARNVHPFLIDLIFDNFDQESILWIDGSARQGYLKYPNKEAVEFLGTLESTSISKAVNHGLEAFTIYGNKAWYLK